MSFLEEFDRKRAGFEATRGQGPLHLDGYFGFSEFLIDHADAIRHVIRDAEWMVSVHVEGAAEGYQQDLRESLAELEASRP